ncbi:MAG TPA: biopolymer transporter ExbD [Candidatus Dormibacteraeota bacterium]|nr:biopolymer transporter ExbD [Candidatus Dormibacteraeota bacterium]
MALSATSARAAVKADINVTPLIDVMLVLLIIFMIVTPIIAAGFQATIPRSANPENRPEGPDEVRLGIDQFGKFYLDLGSGPKQVPDDQLTERLQTIYATRSKDKILFLKADQNIEFGRVQQAIEIARKAGVRVVGAITEQKQSLTRERPRS